MASRKVDFALVVRDAVTNLAECADRIAELDGVYNSSGYDSGGANPITDEDIAGHDITASDLANVSTLAVNLALFLNGGSPLEFDYAEKIDAFRNP